jgi:hypothetical protein
VRKFAHFTLTVLFNLFYVRFIGSTPVDLQTQLSTEEGGGGTISEVGSDLLLADPDDDYQPLDPAYLPPGLEDEAKCEKVCIIAYNTGITNIAWLYFFL